MDLPTQTIYTVIQIVSWSILEKKKEKTEISLTYKKQKEASSNKITVK